jgi:hypothetical protein
MSAPSPPTSSSSSSSSSSYPFWFSEHYSTDGLTSSWAPVSLTDNHRLESALARSEDITYIESRRASADLTTRSLRGCYDFPSAACSTKALPARRIIRAGWLYLDSSSGSPVPLTEEVSKQIEDWFNTIKNGACIQQ